MIVDLVSPWLAAVEATDSTRTRSAFRNRHVALLEALRVARAPTVDKLPLTTDANLLHALARRASDPATQQLLRDALAHAAALGADGCNAVALLAGDGSGGAVTALPRPHHAAALFIEQLADDAALTVALARAATALTRWDAPDSRGLVARAGGAPAGQWEVARNLPLREWIYTEGVGRHLAAALLPGLPPNQLFSLNRAAFDRLRQREKAFRALLDADLDERGVGLVLRWLTPRAPVGPRTIGAVVLPPMAGCYLAWRMTAERVERIGLREAFRTEA